MCRISLLGVVALVALGFVCLVVCDFQKNISMQEVDGSRQ